MTEPIERIDAVATIIYHQKELLIAHNSKWGAFTLPLTKLRNVQLGLAGNATCWESGTKAAMRNVAECLGVTSRQAPGLLLDVGDLRQSDRTGKINHYAVQLFGFPVASRQVAPGVLAEWLTPAHVLEEDRQPISPTARSLLQKLAEAALDRGGNFPPIPAPTLRTSSASIAIIRQQGEGQRVWLCQWNPRWGRYFLVGGHRHSGETPEACMKRELGEELRFEANDYASHVRAPITYNAWSASSWQQTNYDITTFDVTLAPPTLSKVGGDPANRWLTAQEICSERCNDGNG